MNEKRKIGAECMYVCVCLSPKATAPLSSHIIQRESISPPSLFPTQWLLLLEEPHARPFLLRGVDGVVLSGAEAVYVCVCRLGMFSVV